MRPGLTGLWQVSGRSDLSWEQSVQLDLLYVENWSLWGDVADHRSHFRHGLEGHRCVLNARKQIRRWSFRRAGGQGAG